MARFNPSTVNQALSRLRSAQRQLETAARRARYEAEHPKVRIRCTCGYDGTARRTASAMPTACPACGTPILNWSVG